ncbi:MAG: DUF4058 family protein [Gemmataceae bacterium]
MPSPFPGMNPYLEHPAVWTGFHDRCLVYAAEILNAQTLPHFVVELGEHVFVTDPEAGASGPAYHADLSAADPRTGPAVGPSVGTLAAPATVTLPEDFDRARLTYLEVRDRYGQRVVTVVELLSPANKRPGKDRRQFEEKRRALLASDASYVEIDLLRRWPRMPAADMPACDYCVTVSRPDARPRADFWPIRLREPLPPVPIPLRPGLPEPTLDLQALLHRVYDAAGYAYRVYADPPDPPLSPTDAAWAADVLRAAGLPTPPG